MTARIYIFPQHQVQPTKVIATWIEDFERNYFTQRARTPKSETTWKLDYLRVLNRLPKDQCLTPDVLISLAISTPPDTKTRKRSCMALGALARFAGLDVSLKPYAGKYSPKAVTPRDLPDDSMIVEWHDRIQPDDWRWAYGMLATYGLRPHELFSLDLQRLQDKSFMVKVLSDTKTGERAIFPLYPEWVEQFDLLNVRLPRCTGSTNTSLGERVTRAFNRLEIPFPAYALRHCWAVRSLEFGWELSLAARQMGHSTAIHTNTYHAWITERQQQKMFDSLLQRSDCPKAPQSFAQNAKTL